MNYRVVKDNGAVIGTYEAASEDVVIDLIAADAASGYSTHEAAETAAMNGTILIESAD